MPEATGTSPRWLGVLPLAYLLLGLAWVLGSDLMVAQVYRDDFHALVYANTLKGVLFVVLTSTLLYVLVALRRTNGAAHPQTLRPFDLRKPLIAFALVAFGIAAMAFVAYLFEAAEVRDQTDQRIEASALHTATEFSLWHRGRVRSMQQVADSPFTARAIAEWQSSHSDLMESLLRERLQAICTAQDCAGIMAITPAGVPLLQAGSPIRPTERLRSAIKAATATQAVAADWTALDRSDGSRQLVVDLIVALQDRSSRGTPVVAVLVSRADVRWPPPTAAHDSAALGSTIALARIDGEHVIALQPSPGGGAAKLVSLPRARADVSFVRALRGEPGTFAAQDFAGHAVLAAGHPVAGTPWFTVASVERSVVEQQIRRLLLLITGISALGFVAAAALVLPWWRSVRARADALVQQAESRADELAARLGWVTRHASDVILLLDENGRILDVNDRAEQVYGYTRDELLTRDVFSLRPAGALAAMARPPLEAVSPGNSLVFETVQQRKDGTTFPAEVSSRQVSFGDRAYVQSILRDISERRRTEDRLRDSEAQYRLLFRSNPHPMWVYDLATLRFLAVNDAAIQHYGYSEAEFLGLTLADIRLPADLARLNTHVVTHADEVLQLSGIWQHRIKDGSLIDVEITSHSIDFDGHRARLVLANDVTSRVRAERQLRVSEERYRRLFENASDGIVVMTRDHRILAANPELQQMLGYSVDELLGLELPALLDPQEHVRLERSAAAVRRREFPGPSSWLHRRKDGSVFPGEVRIRALPDGELLATVRDLTEINAARRRIERQRDLYDLLSQCNQAIVKITDRPGLLQAVARLAVERGRFLFAWVGELNAQGDVVPVASHGDDHGYVASLRLKADAAAPEAASPASRALREGQTVISNDFLHDPATACFHAAARRSGFAASAAFPIFTGEGVAAALMLYATEPGYFDAEITTTLKEMSADVAHALDALRTQRELEDNRLLLQSVINAADALVFAFDLEGRAILMNEACGRAMGVPRNSMLGRRRDAVMPRELARAHEMNDRQVIESGEKLVVEECNVVAGVETVYLSVKYPLRDIDGRTYAVGGVATDITELRHMQRALAAVNQSLEEKVIARTREADEARARAEAADKAKTVFLSSMSHELRSPLHSIIGFTSVLLDGLAGDLAPAQQEHLRVVSEASHHLLAIINDLLDMSKIEAGAVSLELRPMPVGRLLDRLLQRFRLQAEQKGLELRLDGPGTEVWIDGDELRIEQIVSNLIANAIKYTPAGAVRIDWDCKNDELRIDVRDTGPGISAEDQARLFRRFSQLQPRHGGLVEGTGLGLAIAAGLAEAMGGNVVLRSEMGVGSVFSLRLPLGSKEKSK